MGAPDISTIKGILRFEGREAPAYWRKFALLLTLAVVIATMGLLRNSGAVIIAAMLVAPLMTPILGIASSIVMGWVGRASYLLLIVWLAAAASVFVAWLIVWLSDFPRGIIIPNEILSRTDPGAEDLVVALAAGVAGAYVQIQKSEISLLPGAAIGVSLVPPLAAAGILLYFGQPSRAYEAMLLFATNFGAIILSACIVYVLLRPSRSLFRRGWRQMKFSFGIAVISLFLVVVFGQLFAATYLRFVVARTESALTRKIGEWAKTASVEVLRVDVQPERKTAEVWIAIDLPLDAQYRLASVADLLPEELRQTPFREVAKDVLGEDYKVVVRYQTRIAWQVDLATNKIDPAPAPEGGISD